MSNTNTSNISRNWNTKPSLMGLVIGTKCTNLNKVARQNNVNANARHGYIQLVGQSQQVEKMIQQLNDIAHMKAKMTRKKAESQSSLTKRERQNGWETQKSKYRRGRGRSSEQHYHNKKQVTTTTTNTTNTTNTFTLLGDKDDDDRNDKVTEFPEFPVLSSSSSTIKYKKRKRNSNMDWKKALTEKKKPVQKKKPLQKPVEKPVEKPVDSWNDDDNDDFRITGKWADEEEDAYVEEIDEIQK